MKRISWRDKELEKLPFYLLSIVAGITLGIFSQSIGRYFLEEPSAAILFGIAVGSVIIICLPLILSSLAGVSRGIRDINSTLKQGFGLLEKGVSSSSSHHRAVLYKCRHVKVERVERNEACRIYISCQMRLMDGGCERGCIGYEEPPTRTSGIGLLGGVVGGGALGLVGGPIGVVVGAVLGGFMGNRMEETSLRPMMSELERKMAECREERKRIMLYVLRT